MNSNIDFHAVANDDRSSRNLMIALFDDPEANRDHLIKHLGEETTATVLDLLETHRISASFKEFHLLPGNAEKHGFEWIMFMGLGTKKEMRHIYRLHDRVRSVVAIAARQFRKVRIDNFAVADLADFGIPPQIAGLVVVEGVLLGTYKFDRYIFQKKEKADALRLSDVYLLASEAHEALEAALVKGASRARGTCLARDLVNTPAADLRPAEFADEARKVVESTHQLALKLIDAKTMKKLGMGLHLAVSQGSDNEPCVVVIEYCPKGVDKGWDLALVGKGVTFDSGGYNLKPGSSMTRMYGDMAGAAAVQGALRVIAEQGTELNVVGVMPLAENLVNGAAYKPGDVLKSYKGTTVEILNTDAEGRLLLADSLSYTCATYKPKHMVDIATLTGAIVTALGHFVSGLFTHAESRADDQAFTDQLYVAGRESAEWLWRLPVDDDYLVQIDSDVADLSNCSLDRASGGGAITAAVFLKQFVDFETVTAWAHLDIAASALMERALIYNKCPYQPKQGATGVGVRLLASLAEQLATNAA